MRPASRCGISLLEVLISIGVIAIGIFGVASLIPAAQFRVSQGTTADRVGAMGQSAAAEFRIRGMNSPGMMAGNNQTGSGWWFDQPSAVFFQPDPQHQPGRYELRRRGYCIDPLGLTGLDGNLHSAALSFPGGISAVAPDELRAMAMPRLSLKNGQGAAIHPEVADSLFSSQDELEFKRPDEQQLQPQRQFLIDPTSGQPTKSLSAASLSWFATLSPSEAVSDTTDRYSLSVVVVQGRVRDPAQSILDEGFAVVQAPYAGEVILNDTETVQDPAQVRVADLRLGDWVLLVKFLKPNFTTPVYRWTKITAADDKGGPDSNPNQPRAFTVANDDFLRPGEPAYAIYMRGVRGVVERLIRLENSTAWN